MIVVAQRKTRRDSTAEAISQSADRLEAAAAQVRVRDKRLALTMMKEVERLHAQARALEHQAKRRRRATKNKQDRERAMLHAQQPKALEVPKPQPTKHEWWEV